MKQIVEEMQIECEDSVVADDSLLLAYALLLENKAIRVDECVFENTEDN